MHQKVLLKMFFISSTKLSSSKWKVLLQHALIPSISYTLSNFGAKWDHFTIAHTCWIIDCFDIKCSCTAAHIKSSLWPQECDLWVTRLSKLPQKSTAVVLTWSVLSVCGFKLTPEFHGLQETFSEILLQDLISLEGKYIQRLAWLRSLEHNLMFLLTFGYPHLQAKQ